MKPGRGAAARILLWLSLASAGVAESAAAAAQRTLAKPGPEAMGDESWVRMAVVAASAKGLEGDRPLRFAYRDGERLETMLASVGQIEPANLFLLKAEGRGALLKSLERIGERIAELKGKNRKVFLQFYYSGHGGAKRFHFADGTLDFDEVKAALGGNRADARVYVLDVCFGASFFNAKGFRTAPPVQLQMEMDQAARGEVTISSSSVDEQAYEVKSLGGSIFTSHWIMALRGAGDRNRDGQVTLFEAYNYAYDRTSGYSAETLDRPQHPSFQMDLTGARDMTLARLLRSSTGILFKGCPAGLYNVVDLQRGIQIGELRIPEGEEFTLALEPGRYRVVYLPGRPGRGSSQAADLELASAAMATLPFAAFRAQTVAQGFPKGDTQTDAMSEAGAAGPEKPSGPEAPAGAGIARQAGGAWMDAVPARPVRIGFWTRMGFTAWGGAEGFEDVRLERRMNAASAVDQYFGTEGSFPEPGLKPDLGLDLTYAVHGPVYLGMRFAFSGTEYSRSAVGQEPLNSLPDSARDGYPVTLSGSYRISEVRYGPFLGRGFRPTPRQSLNAEAGIALLVHGVSGERKLARPLYETTKKVSAQTEDVGFRLEAGLGYQIRVPGTMMGKGLALGLRLSPYFASVEAAPDPEGMDWSVQEWGCSAALSFSLLGRSSAANPRYPVNPRGGIGRNL